MTRSYAIYDVFTDQPLSGNQLAVVFDSSGLDGAAMQAIAKEFNLSETVFVGAADNPAHTARIRIFTPAHELPFAGHPTVGTAIALAERRFGNDAFEAVSVLEENVGPVRCAVRRNSTGLYAEFDLPKLPEPAGEAPSKEELAAGLGLSVDEIGFENHVPTVWTAGVAYCCIPVHNLDAAARAFPQPSLPEILPREAGDRIICPYVYTRDTVRHDAHFHVRMFAPWAGIAEDPATGSAAAAFAGAVRQFDGLRSGVNECIIEQGVEMGRTSYIRLEMDQQQGLLHAARIGGHAVKVAEGTLFA